MAADIGLVKQETHCVVAHIGVCPPAVSEVLQSKRV